MRPGDTVVLMFTGTSSYSTERQTVGAIGRLTFNVPRSVVVSEMGSSVQVTYGVQRSGSWQTSPGLNLRINAALSINTSPMNLNGLSVKVPFWTSKYGVESIGNTQVRTPTGGTAPFTYTSSNPSVAAVTPAGLVKGQGNGAATITVRDTSGSAVSYSVNVSNVFRLLQNFGPVTHDQAMAWMRSQPNTQPCSFEAIQDMCRVLGIPLPPGNRHFWRCEQGGCGAGSFAFYHYSYSYPATICAGPTHGAITSAWCLART